MGTCTRDGHIAINAEHSWADGAVTCHLTEEANVLEHLLVEYCPDTRKIIGEADSQQPIVKTLQFTNLDQLLKPVRGELPMTYEAALARIFKDGRTETIRSCTPQAALFIKEMTDKTSDKERRRKALSNAVRVHGELTKCAMIGQGVDRHLFALCVASGGLNLDSDFLNKYKSAKWENVNGWELSTSGAPIGFGELYNPRKFPHLKAMAAGFGWTNGFGIGYMIHDDSLEFSVSCSTEQNLDASKFCEALVESLLQINELFD